MNMLSKCEVGKAQWWAISLMVASLGTLAAQPQILVRNSFGYPGVSVQVPLATTASNWTAFQTDIAFDITKVSSESAQLAANLSNHLILSREISPGIRRILVYSTGLAAGSNRFSVANLPFAIFPAQYVSGGQVTPQNSTVVYPGGSATAASGTAGEIFVGPLHITTNGAAQFFFPTAANVEFAIDASTNLIDWINLTNVIAEGAFTEMVDSEAPLHPHRFYRAKPIFP